MNMRTTQQILDHDFLEARCQLLEVAAMLDRCDRASKVEKREGAGPTSPEDRPSPDDRRLDFIYQSFELLADRNSRSNRAEQLLNLYSDPI